MNLKISPKYSIHESPYKLFSNDIFLSNQKNSFTNKNPRNNFPLKSQYAKFYNKPAQIRPMTTITRMPSAVSSISKSLKSVALSLKTLWQLYKFIFEFNPGLYF